jgi:hypothetical protein
MLTFPTPNPLFSPGLFRGFFVGGAGVRCLPYPLLVPLTQSQIVAYIRLVSRDDQTLQLSAIEPLSTQSGIASRGRLI